MDKRVNVISKDKQDRILHTLPVWARDRIAALEAERDALVQLRKENARLLSDPMNVGWQRAQDAIKDRAAAVSQWKAERIKCERAEAEVARIRQMLDTAMELLTAARGTHD